ncbi:DUF2169 domain-containing protein [Burkholderia contaminans]|uniref:DUF2169 family type VI secretion system accessory protein n=1 Tax=Burkholderia contaminans TaxID=488447 RepID=UPI001CF51CC7|nr:DUF2169 domain-containing protein [Burkholderia contaminans]MCA7918745.1 DUF2169 domain-containing protein [Burkholderia contaminans]UUX35742.1 DUF2169 domain-containing protein [Burkholderia contaminans]
MEFRNLTPFEALCFQAQDLDGEEHPVVAMKVGYRLHPVAGQPGQCVAQVLDDAPLPLCLADVYEEEPGISSVREESDLAPFKPRCDVIVVGHAHAPGGRPTTTWLAGLRITAAHPPHDIPDPPPPTPAAGQRLTYDELQAYQAQRQEAERQRAAQRTPQVLLDKHLRVSGPRQFEHGLLTWRAGEIAPAAAVVLRWEHAFGGTSRIDNPAYAHDPAAPPTLLNEVCYSNPLGGGWLDHRFEKLYYQQHGELLTRLYAPQITYPDDIIERPYLAHPPAGELDADGMAEQAASYAHAPAGFGVVGRAWAPRLALAGSYDNDWLAQRWPGLPEDFDFGYWNGAPEDQQIAYLPTDARIELHHLVDPRLSDANGTLSVTLPGHRPFVLMRLTNGVMLPLPLLTDTVRIDTDAMTLSLTHRLSLPNHLDIRVLEARFEVDPAAPILRRAPRKEAA